MTSFSFAGASRSRPRVVVADLDHGDAAAGARELGDLVGLAHERARVSLTHGDADRAR